MNLPTLLLGLLISTLYGALFHLIRGGNFSRLLLYLVLSWIGFWSGQLIANQLNLTLLSVGSLHLGLATLGSLLLLLLGSWLTQSEPTHS
jgi:uncharacterized membrane protein YeaQ/YmgE (transglycosylase-associated protein family)